MISLLIYIFLPDLESITLNRIKNKISVCNQIILSVFLNHKTGFSLLKTRIPKELIAAMTVNR